eukprot:3931956-Rhodomonas_salina.1
MAQSARDRMRVLQMHLTPAPPVTQLKLDSRPGPGLGGQRQCADIGVGQQHHHTNLWGVGSVDSVLAGR